MMLPEIFNVHRDWIADSSGNWTKDNQLGRARANELQAHIRITENYPALGHVAKMIADGGHFGGIEVGFYQRVSELMAR